MKKLANIFLTMILLLQFAYASDADRVVKIGLYYGGNALAEPQLQNFVGEGYEFGYFDSDNEFESIYSVENIKLLMKVDKSYNIAVDELYDDIDEAEDDIATLKKTGKVVFPAYIDGKIQIRIGNYASVDEAEEDIEVVEKKAKKLEFKVVKPDSNTISVTDTDSKEILFEYTKDEYNLGIMPMAGKKEIAQTWFKQLKYYGGFEYIINGSNISVINNVKLCDYIKGVIPYEISPSWPVEAQKAQALCAKNYTLRSLNRHASSGFSLCNTTHCQVYKGTSNATATSDEAVEDVIDKSIYYNGELAETYYYSSNGGASENSENVWTSAIPYLVGVEDEFENDSIPNWSYESKVTLKDLQNLLTSKGYKIGPLKSVSTELTEMGNMYKVIFTDTAGKQVVVSKDSARSLFSKYVRSMRFNIYPEGGVAEIKIIALGDKKKEIKASNYVISEDGDKTKIKDIKKASILTSKGIKKINNTTTSGSSDTYIIKGTGYGHNVGMSQWGAKIMADEGYEYDEILKYYFTGVEIK